MIERSQELSSLLACVLNKRACRDASAPVLAPCRRRPRGHLRLPPLGKLQPTPLKW